MSERFMYEDARRARDYVEKRVRAGGLNPENIKDSIVLGSGLGDFVKNHMAKGSLEIAFNEAIRRLNLRGDAEKIPLSPGGAKGHAQTLIIGPLMGDSEERLVVAQSGREHPYEGVSTKRSTFWLRIMQLLGVETLFGSSAVGIVTPNTLTLPSLMLVRDHRDLGGDNPLVGHNEPRFGPRFPHCGDLYPAQTRELVKRVAASLDVPIKEGILFRLLGPDYENEATIYDLRATLQGIYDQAKLQPGSVGYEGDPVGVVGMSSTFEHLVCQHASANQNIGVDHPNRAFSKGRAHVSVGTNYACGLGPDGPGAFPNHDEVKENAARVEEFFGRLAMGVIKEMRKG